MYIENETHNDYIMLPFYHISTKIYIDRYKKEAHNHYAFYF